MKKIRINSKFLFRIISCLTFVHMGIVCISQNSDNKGSSKTNWDVKNPFDQKAFVENKGQFDDNIKYAVSNQGVDIYFTSSGVIYRHVEQVKLSEEEREKIERQEEKHKSTAKEEEKISTTSKSYFLNMRWQGANPDGHLIAENEVSNYYTYGDQKDKSGKSTIKANAFKKIIYQNIYPHIDVEYVFPENKEGIEYNFILHPGADAASIKMKYDGAKNLSLDDDGNLKIKSVFGVFTDHVPVTYYRGGENINSSFVLNKNNISFQLENYDNTKTVVIDPWTTAPLFTGGWNSAFDIDYDYKGNVYIYGGNPPRFQLIKLDPSGVIQWTYTAPFPIIPGGPGGYYGDFALDRNTGTAYLCEGFDPNGAGMFKVNTAGSQITLFPRTLKMNEMWRIAYNSCTNQGVIGLGNTKETYQGATFDTTLTNVVPVNILSTSYSYTDIGLLAIDDTNAYMLSTSNLNKTSPNILAKASLATLSPVAYLASTHEKFQEDGVVYAGSWCPGFNGMAKNKKYLYTYNGATLKKWNSWNGTLIDSVVVDFTYPYGSAGIAVDDCDNVFVGCKNGVKQYNSTLALVNFTATKGIVYDVALGGKEKQVFACGFDFVSALPLYSLCSEAPSFSLNASSTSSTCAGNDGAVTVSISGGTPPFNYLWMPGGQTTQTVTGLPAGTYKVFVSESNGMSCGNRRVNIDTITVSASSGFAKQSITNTNATCFGANNGTATIITSGGTIPYTYLWSPGGKTTNTITGLSQGIYTVKVKDSKGCQTLDSVAVSSPAPITITPIMKDITCLGIGTIKLDVKGGTMPYSYSWSTGEFTEEIGVDSVGTYTVTVTDFNGCSASKSIDVTNASWSLSSITLTDATCNGNNGSIVFHLLNGASYNIYHFVMDSAFNTIGNINDSIFSNLSPGVYYCDLLDNFWCFDTSITITVGSNPNLIPVVTGNKTICTGQSTTLTASGGINYSWSPGGATTAAITVSPANSTTYTVTAVGGGCSGSSTVVVMVSAPPIVTTNNITICSGSSAMLNASGANTYIWNPATGLSSTTGAMVITNTTATTTYTITGSNAGCSATAKAIVTVNPVSVANAGNDVTINYGVNTMLTATGGGTYTWSPSTGLNCNSCQNPMASPAITTDYCVTVTNGNGCSATDCVTIFVESGDSLFIPNAYSPNGDGINDVFKILIEGYKNSHVEIYNRWGTKLFETDDGQKNFWDGTNQKSGRPVPEGVYFYVIDLKNSTGNENETKGFVQLVR